jgi:hypothetical protein
MKFLLAAMAASASAHLINDECADNYNWKIQDLNATVSIQPNSYEVADVNLSTKCITYLQSLVMSDWGILAIYGGKVQGTGYKPAIVKVTDEDMRYYLDGKDKTCTQELLYEPKTQSITSDQALDLLEGFLEGAVAAESFDELSKCITDAEPMIPAAEKAFKDCKTNSLNASLLCIADMAALAKEATTTLSDCENVGDDIAKLKQIVAAFTSPMSFIWHAGKDLLLNGVNIYNDIEAATDAYKAGNWKEFGKKAGDATALVVLGAESQEGFLSGYYELEIPEQMIEETEMEVEIDFLWDSEMIFEEDFEVWMA